MLTATNARRRNRPRYSVRRTTDELLNRNFDAIALALAELDGSVQIALDDILGAPTVPGSGAVGGSGIATEVPYWSGTVGVLSSTLASHDDFYYDVSATTRFLRLTAQEAVGGDTGSYPLVPLVLRAKYDGTPVAGFGTGVLFQAEDAGGTMETLGSLNLLWADAGASSEDSDFAIKLRAAGASSAEVARFKGTGRLGIGTTAPDYDLHIKKNATAVWSGVETTSVVDGAFAYYFAQAASLLYIGDYVWVAATTGTFIGLAKASLAVSEIGSGASAHLTLTRGASSMHWATNDTLQMTLTPGGLFGVGQSTPVSKVHAHDNTSSGVALEVMTIERSRADSTAPAGDFGGFLGYRLEGFTNGTTVLVAALLAAWENTQTNNTTDRDTYMSFATMMDNTISERMRLTSAGRLGVCQQSPLSKVHAREDESSDLTLEVMTIERMRADSSAPAGGFGGFLGYRLEGFTSGGTVLAAAITGAWENTQTNNTTARDSYLSFATMLDNTISETVRITSDGSLRLVLNGGFAELYGSSPSIAVSSSGQVRLRNNAGEAQFSENGDVYRAALSGHGRQLGTITTVASASQISIGNANAVVFTGSTDVNYITVSGESGLPTWTAGSVVWFFAGASAVTLKYNTGSVPAAAAAIILTGGVDLTIGANDCVALMYVGSYWVQITPLSPL